MNTEAKQTADILLDLYSAVADTRDDVIDDALFQSIVLRLQLAGAFTGTVGAHGEVELNITQLLVATTLPTMWLLQRLSHETGRSPEELLFDLRTQLEPL